MLHLSFWGSIFHSELLFTTDLLSILGTIHLFHPALILHSAKLQSSATEIFSLHHFFFTFCKYSSSTHFRDSGVSPPSAPFELPRTKLFKPHRITVHCDYHQQTTIHRKRNYNTEQEEEVGAIHEGLSTCADTVSLHFLVFVSNPRAKRNRVPIEG